MVVFQEDKYDSDEFEGVDLHMEKLGFVDVKAERLVLLYIPHSGDRLLTAVFIQGTSRTEWR